MKLYRIIDADTGLLQSEVGFIHEKIARFTAKFLSDKYEKNYKVAVESVDGEYTYLD